MREKSSPTSTITITETTITPRSCLEKRTPPTSIGAVENGPLNCFAAPPQIHVVRPLIAISRPIVRITTASVGARSTGRTKTVSTTTPPANESTSVAANAGQNVRPLSINAQQTNADSVAISPCAKLSTPVARWTSTIASASEP